MSGENPTGASPLDLQISKKAQAWRVARLRRPRDLDLHVKLRREIDALCDQALKAGDPAAPAETGEPAPSRLPYRDD